MLPLPPSFQLYPARSRLVLSVVVFVLAAAPTHAAFELDDPSSFLLPLAGPQDLTSNPADLTGPSCWRWQVGHQLLFGLRQLSAHHLAAAVSRPRWGLGTGLSLRGPDRHRESAVWLGIGFSPAPRLAVGSGLHLLQLTPAGLGAERVATVSAGVRLQLPSHLTLSAWWRGAAADLADARLHLRFTRALGDHSALRGYLTRRGRIYPHRLHLSTVARLHPRLWLFLGTRSAPRQFATGWRTEAGQSFLEYRVQTHSQLGASHSALAGRSCKRP